MKKTSGVLGLSLCAFLTSCAHEPYRTGGADDAQYHANKDLARADLVVDNSERGGIAKCVSAALALAEREKRDITVFCKGGLDKDGYQNAYVIKCDPDGQCTNDGGIYQLFHGRAVIYMNNGGAIPEGLYPMSGMPSRSGTGQQPSKKRHPAPR
ncbi:MAG: hypothetical protein IPI58_02810 [Alphaproteobacteria bacterium]|nr:MAG: hypothetical protein IPI58_02810 [Alphaproteobacteria bacterium]